MNGRIFGFQRFVWCPKCTPASMRDLSGRGISPGARGGSGSWDTSVVTSAMLRFSFRLFPPLFPSGKPGVRGPTSTEPEGRANEERVEFRGLEPGKGPGLRLGWDAKGTRLT